MPTSYLTRVVEFTATHRLPGTDFGKAAEDHSHRYRCRVTVRGALRATQGGVISLHALDALLQREVVARFDGRHLNRDVPEFAEGRLLPTGDALAVYICDPTVLAPPPDPPLPPAPLPS